MRNVKLVIRDVVTSLVIVVPLLVVALGAWATQNPTHPRVAAARGWPIAGDWVARLIPVPLNAESAPGSQRLAQAASAAGTAYRFSGVRVWFEAGTHIHAQPRTAAPNQVLEVPTRLDIVEQRGGWLRLAGTIDGWTRYTGDPTALAEAPSQHRTTWLRPGTQLRDRPGGEVVNTMDRIANLPVVATGTGAWVQVIADDRKLWVEAPDFTGGEPPLGSEPTPLAPLAAVPITIDRLAAARPLLATDEIAADAGPYRIVGNSPRVHALVAACAPLLAHVDAAFERHTGLAPVGPARETLLVFDSRRDYRAFLSDAPRVLTETGDPDGYALPAQGFAATYFEGRSLAEVCSVLVHEAAHLTSRRALGPALPPWLAEGLATWIEGRQLTPTDSASAGSLVRLDDEFYATDLDRRYRTVAAIIHLLLTDTRWRSATRAFLADRAAARPMPGRLGASAEDYWSALLGALETPEDALWQALDAIEVEAAKGR